jgi:hypothetical protein
MTDWIMWLTESTIFAPKEPVEDAPEIWHICHRTLCRTSYEISDLSLRKGLHLLLILATVFWPHRPAPQCH